MIKNGRPIRVRSGRFRQALRLWPVLIVLVPVLAGCGIVSDIRYEQRIEARARKYGERLPESQLGPFKGFTREEYFKHKCDTEAGEFIYKTVDNVEGVYQMRLRDPRDFIDRLRAEDIPEDPWGHTGLDASGAWAIFVDGYEFFETTEGVNDRGKWWHRDVFSEKPPVGESRYWRYRLGESDGNKYRNRRFGEKVTRPLVVEKISELKSRYGYNWREVRDRYDRHFGVWGGELWVEDLKTGEILAKKRGFFDARYAICPRDKDVDLVYKFVSKVLRSGLKSSRSEEIRYDGT